MQTNYDKYIIDIIDIASINLNVRYNIASLSWISRPNFKEQVADAALIFKIKGINGKDDAVFIVSNSDFPDFVQLAAKKAEKISTLVSAEVSSAILHPKFSGSIGKQSFSVYPMLLPISQNRLICAAQKYSIKKSVYKWIADLCISSQRSITSIDDMNEFYIKPLSYICEESQFSDAFRKAAERTMSSIKTKQFIPICCIQHGDFWLGNILLNRDWPKVNAYGNKFSVIDWGGANINGYPFIDLLRYTTSSTRSRPALFRNLQDYSRYCSIPPDKVIDYVCAGIGWLGLNRNEFPFDRYIHLGEKLFSTASDLIDVK